MLKDRGFRARQGAIAVRSDQVWSNCSRTAASGCGCRCRRGRPACRDLLLVLAGDGRGWSALGGLVAEARRRGPLRA